MPSDEMVEKACAAYWENYRDAWRPYGILTAGHDVPFAELSEPVRVLTAKAMRAALTAAMGETIKPPAGIADVAAMMEIGARYDPVYRYQTPDTRSFSQTTPPMTPDRNAIERSFPLPAHPSREDVVEEAAKIADAQAEEDEGNRKRAATSGAEGDASHYLWCVHTAKSIAAAIRKLKERS